MRTEVAPGRPVRPASRHSLEPFQWLVRNRPISAPQSIHTPSYTSDNASDCNGAAGGDGKARVEQGNGAGPDRAGAHPGAASRPGRAGRPRRRPARRQTPASARSPRARRGRGALPDRRYGVRSVSRRLGWDFRLGGRRCRAACRAFPHAGAGGGCHAGADRCRTVLPARRAAPWPARSQATRGCTNYPLTGPSGHLSPIGWRRGVAMSATMFILRTGQRRSGRYWRYRSLLALLSPGSGRGGMRGVTERARPQL